MKQIIISLGIMSGIALIFAGIFTYDPLTSLGAVISATSGLFIFEK